MRPGACFYISHADSQGHHFREAVLEGEEITITKHGVPVAVLVPPPGKKRRSTAGVIEELGESRKGNTLGGSKIEDLIEEGRRF